MQTILGNLSTDKMGRTLVHEHIYVGSMDMRLAFGDRWYSKKQLIELAAKELAWIRQTCGISTIIDATTPDIGRDLTLIREAASASGVNILYCTGLYHGETPFIAGKNPEKFADYFIAECCEGSALPDGTVGQTKPAFLKCATDRQGITAINRIALSTMAIAQRETGLPLYCHNAHSQYTAADQLMLFREYGADLSRVIIGHASDTTDLPYLTQLLEAGCHLSFDRIGIRPERMPAQAQTIAALIARGWLERITLSHDYSVYINFGSTPFEQRLSAGAKQNLGCISNQFLPHLEACGVTASQIDTMMVDNPARLYGGG